MGARVQAKEMDRKPVIQWMLSTTLICSSALSPRLHSRLWYDYKFHFQLFTQYTGARMTNIWRVMQAALAFWMLYRRENEVFTLIDLGSARDFVLVKCAAIFANSSLRRARIG